MNFIKQSFIHLTYIQIPVIITFILAILAIILGVIIILLDTAYRPNIPQYPFNIVLDRIVPLCALISPTLFVLFLSPFDAWFHRFCLLLGIHIIILVPLFHYWSSLRQWSNDSSSSDSNKIWSWSHPRLFLHIAIALIYPSLWGIYFSLSRYIRLGSTIDLYSFISSFFTFYLDWIILALFILPHVFLWIIIPSLYLSNIRRYLWVELSSLLYSLHLFLLAYNLYFIVMEKLFKFSHLCYSLISLNGPIYFKKEVNHILRQLINYLFYNPKVIDILFLISLPIEVYFCNGKLFYGIYTLFFYPLTRSILSIFFSFYLQDWFHDCCLSDYLRSNFISPHYPIIFWAKSEEALFYYGFQYELPQHLLDIQQTYINKHSIILKRSAKLNIKIVKSKNKYSFSFRYVTNVYSQTQIRWVHTQVSTKLHSATPLFMRNIYDRINLINDTWRNISRIQYLDKNKYLTPTNLYHNFNNTYPIKKDKIIGIHEENIPTFFVPLMNHNVSVEPFNKDLHIPSYFPQVNPDLFLGFSKSSFKDRRNHALDVKTNGGLGLNHILAEISQERYATTLNRHRKQLDFSTATEINLVFDNLIATCHDFDLHQMVWAKSLHLFSPHMLPPLRLPQNFNTKLFTQEALIELQKSATKLRLISDHLISKKVPNVSGNEYPQEAYDLFQDSYVQKLLSET